MSWPVACIASTLLSTAFDTPFDSNLRQWNAPIVIFVVSQIMSMSYFSWDSRSDRQGIGKWQMCGLVALVVVTQSLVGYLAHVAFAAFQAEVWRALLVTSVLSSASGIILYAGIAIVRHFNSKYPSRAPDTGRSEL
jgi:hypothetical protein